MRDVDVRLKYETLERRDFAHRRGGWGRIFGYWIACSHGLGRGAILWLFIGSGGRVVGRGLMRAWCGSSLARFVSEELATAVRSWSGSRHSMWSRVARVYIS